MNLMEAILGGNGSPVSTMAKQFGLDDGDVTKVIQQVLPAMTNGVKKNVARKGGLENLLQALNKVAMSVTWTTPEPWPQPKLWMTAMAYSVIYSAPRRRVASWRSAPPNPRGSAPKS